MAKDLKEYIVTQARFIAGQYRAVDEAVQMTERSAKYYMEPYGAGLRSAEPVKAAGKSGK